MSHRTFHVDAWSVKLHQALAPVDILQALLADVDVGALLKPRLKGVSYLSQTTIDMNETYLKGESDIAVTLYANQLLVLSITYAELIVKDFYRCLFRAHPLRMNPVLSPDGKSKALIGLNTIVAKRSRSALLAELADEAAQRMSGRRIDDSVARVVKDSGITLSRPLVDDLRDLVNRRNRVVHDGTSHDLTWSQVHSAFGQMLYLLYVLGEAALTYKLPVSDTVNFMHDFRDKLKP